MLAVCDETPGQRELGKTQHEPGGFQPLSQLVASSAQNQEDGILYPHRSPVDRRATTEIQGHSLLPHSVTDVKTQQNILFCRIAVECTSPGYKIYGWIENDLETPHLLWVTAEGYRKTCSAGCTLWTGSWWPHHLFFYGELALDPSLSSYFYSVWAWPFSFLIKGQWLHLFRDLPHCRCPTNFFWKQKALFFQSTPLLLLILFQWVLVLLQYIVYGYIHGL